MGLTVLIRYLFLRAFVRAYFLRVGGPDRTDGARAKNVVRLGPRTGHDDGVYEPGRLLVFDRNIMRWPLLGWTAPGAYVHLAKIKNALLWIARATRTNKQGTASHLPSKPSPVKIAGNKLTKKSKTFSFRRPTIAAADAFSFSRRRTTAVRLLGGPSVRPKPSEPFNRLGDVANRYVTRRSPPPSCNRNRSPSPCCSPWPSTRRVSIGRPPTFFFLILIPAPIHTHVARPTSYATACLYYYYY